MPKQNGPVDLGQISRAAVEALAITPRAHALVQGHLAEVLNPPPPGAAVWRPDGSPATQVATGYASVPGRRLKGAVDAAEAVVQRERDLTAQQSSVGHELPTARVRTRVIGELNP